MKHLFYNTVIFAMIVLGSTILCRAFGLLGFLWTFFVAYSLYFQLRKDLCTNCPFYGKPCFSGWGLLASKLFERNSGNFERGRKLAAITWGSFLLLPPTILILVGDLFTLILWLLASFYVFSEFYNFHKTCPLRSKCEGKG
ncbi:hypothetical protein EYM_05720 [Ignicoccus islandicus DSM 13165]|uniref:DUF4395 domain-containing protein n=1 Tax=Ignicoccus islandicus DSM 13165 TaxID=940295 RepID=A0A0U3FLB6_9CREN|nr:hypothetical protein [Ignicoccus islandicus]ALU12614.1 hypothetical protein EYM_05720 [Ignicoccus islandicus DSM 13165]